MLNRRQFLVSAASLAGLTLLGGLPAAARLEGNERSVPDDRMLVLVHLFGGNDALNTVVPVGDARYRKARPRLALSLGDTLELSGGLRLNQALKPLLPMWEADKLAIINGVGYPGANQSHFISSDIWHTGRVQTRGSAPEGWLGRCLDLTGWTGVSVDRTLARALWARKSQPLSVKVPDQFKLRRGEVFASHLDAMYAQKELPRHLRSTYTRMRSAMKQVARSLENCPGEKLTPNDFGKALKTILALMPAARIYHTTLPGFDTHSGQTDRHPKMLDLVARGLSEFWAALEEKGWADKTTVVVYSEFGRRMDENASGGTDHGAAGTTFVLGNHVRGGLHGEYPDLADLESGNLRHTVDFRTVYAALLEGWLEADAAAILGGRYPKLRLFG